MDRFVLVIEAPLPERVLLVLPSIFFTAPSCCRCLTGRRRSDRLLLLLQ